ncbi:MAG: MoaD/ThiS family protein [Candidatus Hodarchaeota archaeon]
MSENEDIFVTVKFFADLLKFGPQKSKERFPKNSTIKSILEKYKISEKKSKLIILVNGKPHITVDYLLNEGDIVAIFPPIAGG